jgi:hypothetical protein
MLSEELVPTGAPAPRTGKTSRPALPGRDVGQLCANGAHFRLRHAAGCAVRDLGFAADVSKRHAVPVNGCIVRFERKELGRCGISADPKLILCFSLFLRRWTLR